MATKLAAKNDRNSVLEKMAKNLVGDGKKPNVFFVIFRNSVRGVFACRVDAFEFAEDLRNKGLFVRKGVVVEDRLHGVIYEDGLVEKF